MLKVTGNRSKKAAAWIGVSAMTLTLLSTAVYQAESATEEAETEAAVTATAANGDVVLSTDYPGITVEPGTTTTFNPVYDQCKRQGSESYIDRGKCTGRLGRLFQGK